MTSRPLFRFALIADVQYADEDRPGEPPFRDALPKLERCVADLAVRDLDFVVQLGDVINGRDAVEDSRTDLERILDPLEGLGVPLVHVVGNHCLSVPRAELTARLGLERAHRSFVRASWRFVVLDTMDMPGAHAVNVHWKGRLGPAQLDWLSSELAAAEASGERVVILAHHPVAVEASRPSHLLANHEDALAVLDRSSAVVAWICGHDHRGGDHARRGVRHWTVPAMLTAPGTSNAYAVVEGFADRLVATGFGSVPSTEIRR